MNNQDPKAGGAARPRTGEQTPSPAPTPTMVSDHIAHASTNCNAMKEQDPGKMTIVDLVGSMTVGQLWSTLSAIIVLVGGAFGLGMWVSSTKAAMAEKRSTGIASLSNSSNVFLTGLNLGRAQIFARDRPNQASNEIRLCLSFATNAGYSRKIIDELEIAASQEGTDRINTLDALARILPEQLKPKKP